MNRERGWGPVQIFIGLIVLSIAWVVLLRVFEWVQEVKHDRTYGPNGEEIEATPPPYQGPKGYQIRQ